MNIETYKRREEKNISEDTLNPRLSALRHLEEFIEGQEPDVNDIEDWIDYMMESDKFKDSTTREYFKAAKYYFEVVKGEHGELEHITRWLPSNDSDAGDHLTEDEWKKLYANIQRRRDRAIFNLMYHYARRPSEILYLNREDVDFEENTIRFLILKKTDPNLPEIYIDGQWRKLFRATFKLKEEPKKMLQKALKYMPETTETIEERIAGGEVHQFNVQEGKREVQPLFSTSQGRLSYASVYNTLKEASEQSGIDKNITPKTMRHSRATHLDWGGRTPGNIAREMLMHEPDTTVIGRYIHDRSGDTVRDPMEMDGNEQ